MNSSPYSILGVADGAPAEECKAAYRKLAKQFHPDLNQGDPSAEARFKEISAAYEAITNPPAPEPNVAHGFHNFHFNMNGGFDELFAHLRGGRSDVTYEVRLTLEEAYRGKDVPIQAAGRELKVAIPPGIEDGTRLIIQQGAQQVNPNARPGDLFILIRIMPHQRFTRLGLNLITTVPVTAFDVMLGNEVEVVSIEGKTIRVAIPDNFDSTRKLRLAGQGLVDGRGMRGDMLVDLYITYPALSAAKRDALRTLIKN